MQVADEPPAPAPVETPPPLEPPPAETVLVAKLDGEGRYFGVQEMAKADVPEGAVVMPRNHDLPQDGSFRWQRDRGYFAKSPPAGPVEAMSMQAETVTALAGIGFAMMAADAPLPPLVIKWLRWFQTTLDFTGLATKTGDGQLVVSLVKPSEFKG